MHCLEKVRSFVKRCGTPAKFVARSILGAVVAGCREVLELIDKLIDRAHETAQGHFEELASPEDLQHIETIFDLLLGDMQDVVEQLRRLEKVPDLAKKTLYRELRDNERCFAAARAIEEQVAQLSGVRAQLAKLSVGQEGLRDLQRRHLGTMLDFIASRLEDHAHGIVARRRTRETVQTRNGYAYRSGFPSLPHSH
jgi:hypothetical protein